MTELKNDDLEKVSGGWSTTIEIDDNTIISKTGYNWAQLESLMETFLNDATANGYSSDVKLVKEIFTSHKVDFMKIGLYKSSLANLKNFANTSADKYASIIAVIVSLEAVFGL